MVKVTVRGFVTQGIIEEMKRYDGQCYRNIVTTPLPPTSPRGRIAAEYGHLDKVEFEVLKPGHVTVDRWRSFGCEVWFDGKKAEYIV